MAAIPHLRSTQTSQQLIVHSKPYLICGAELQNSSFSSGKYMRELWPSLVDMNLNTVLGSVSWEMVEPEEGLFDFSEVDRIILDARIVGLKLILLWFGMSNYVPPWVKLSPERFPRARLRNATGGLKTTEILSPFHRTSMEADARAFAALMKHLKETDGSHNTVIMVQPENECGILGDSRDRSELANKAFGEAVPGELIDFLRSDWEQLHVDLKNNLQPGYDADFGGKGASWTSAFGTGLHTDELFMAYHYTKFVSTVATAGKAEYPLPMFCNFWQNYNGKDSENDFPWHAGGGGCPGDYPSGGGVSTTLDIWIKFAENIDFICPDVYLNDYTSICKTYRHRNQPLFIPEQRRDERGARRIWKAIGSFQALGTSPFGVDSLAGECAYKSHFKLLKSVSELVLDAQTRPDAMMGFFFDEVKVEISDAAATDILCAGGFRVRAERAFTVGKAGPGFGLVIYMDSPAENVSKYLLVGEGFQAVFESLTPEADYTGILSFVEKEVNPATGKLETLRRLNGDETRSGRFAIMPNEDPDYGGFPISITIPARTRIAECTVYWLKKG
ncbi:hypothetical protein SLS60_006297 [Paraconiothyrium brasiliense]|uniref:Beta-galactosidase n=1 Tax=Paraconiothyrium brasiliense TaxID=300254 RepID=A0ABR3RAC1_9PLEO